ncbi:acyl-CoA dehydrogenase [Nocardia panacis]|uniref:Acyl-CoA dehydrogenase n=1 Tax=Nocardia panacis TaxID=2340916 RepID=A0A3A4KC34_9NOCA|nr:acyl-CoA dehydrogenase family protein [Nocardia panacis]RJO71270.1 acyl-CoA dehydrogenase [Nocardia panacis]
MRFALEPEQLDFGAGVRKILESGHTAEAVRAWGAGDPRKGRALHRQLAAAGVLGLLVEERHGGAGAEPLDMVVAFLELGRAAAPGPLIESAVAIPTLLQALPDDTPAGELLPDLASGDRLATLALGATALDADNAEVVLLAADGRVCFGHRTGLVRSVDPARRLSTVTPDEVIAADVDAAIAAAFDAGALACAAQLLGAGRALLDATTAYAKQRSQYGHPIGEYQAVKQQVAAVLIGLELAEPLLLRAALTLRTPTGARDVSAAALACGRAAHRAARTALQVHGAIGYTAEYDLSLLLTRVTALRSAWGTADSHRARIARALRAEVDAR